MGHPTNAAAELLAPVEPGGCWIDDPETEGGRLLRPDFSASWTDNSVWHDSMTKFVKTHLASISPSFSEDDVKSLGDTTIKSQVQTVFKGIISKYRKWAKSKDTAEIVAPVEHADLPGVKNRRSRRKERVSKHFLRDSSSINLPVMLKTESSGAATDQAKGHGK